METLLEPAGLTTTSADAALPERARVSPWIDPVVDRRGHDPRSSYVERFWLATLGPTATWLLRRLVAGFDTHPDGYDLELAATAQALGLGMSRGTSSAFAKAFGRCIMFGLAHQRSDGFAVRRRLPELTRRHVTRLPADLQVEHEHWRTAATTLDVLGRGRALATAMIDAGDDAALLEPQLVALGIPATAACEVVELLRAAPVASPGADETPLSHRRPRN